MAPTAIPVFLNAKVYYIAIKMEIVHVCYI